MKVNSGTSTLLPKPAGTSRELRAARQFESVMLASVFGALQKTFTEIGGKPSDPAAENYSAMGMQALADGVAAVGGVGLAKMIAADLARRDGAFPERSPLEKVTQKALTPIIGTTTKVFPGGAEE